MAGKPQKSEKLNNTLIKVVKKFEERGIKNWFLAYGTLLGIARENSCIDGDDDIDICLDFQEWESGRDALESIGKTRVVHMQKGNLNSSVRFMRLFASKNNLDVDIYVCDVSRFNNYYDMHEKVIWQNCTPFEKIKWRGVTLQLPKNYLNKLKNRYGDTWNERIERGTPAGDGFRRHALL